ncbi:hypothetical protein DQ04_23721000 [Trypanosoma grayi]|uniref:hypothetical protein n=1 Tax=Trypanosoma grayi TaxID=71804 RepID=UPI0004F4B5BD|nr:hypothetical protein DQ04_23721000 [Trypanosoma grayi]KEG05311.1 hypothetical protein DQ04_23721000 [Trypanosoma grayi]
MEVINRALDDVEHELNVSDRTVRSMSWTGKVKNWFTSKPRKPQSCAGAGGTAGSGSASAPSSSSPSAAPPRQQRQQEPRRVGEAGGGGSSSSNGETGTSNGHLSKEEDKLLDTLLNSVGAMREQASLQGELLAGHNRRLDEMSAKTDAVRGHMERTDRSVRKLL